MAITLVQTGTSINVVAGSVLGTFNTPLSSGNLVMVAGFGNFNGTLIGTLKDDKSNVYNRVFAHSAANFADLEFWYAKNIVGGGSVITASLGTNNSPAGIYIREYSGLDTTKPLDVFGTNSGTGTLMAGTTPTTNFGSELLIYIAGINNNTGGNGTPNDASWIHRGTSGTASSANITLVSADKIVSSTGAYAGTAVWTDSTSKNAIGIIGMQAAGTIQFDSKGGTYTYPGTTLSWTHTVGAGSNPGLFVTAQPASGAGYGTVSNIKFAGTSLTRIRADNGTLAPGTSRSEIWYLANPPAGLGTFTGTFSANTAIAAQSYSFTGVGTPIPDAQSGGTGAGSVVSGTVTTSADNSWCLICVDLEASTGSLTADSFWTIGTSFENTTGVVDFSAYGGPQTPAGARTYIGTNPGLGGTGLYSYSMISIAPYVAPAGTSTYAGWKTLMGVGQ